MSKVHVLVPFTTQVVCGEPGFYQTAAYREQVTCKQCRQSDQYKALDNLPKRYRKHP